MRILIFGDIVARPGRAMLGAALSQWKKEYAPDFVIANAENLAHGVGVTQRTLQECVDAGVHFFTSGNHVWKNKEVLQIFETKQFPLLRPLNYPPGTPGPGFQMITLGSFRLLVINLMGRVFFREHLDCPFRAADDVLKQFHLGHTTTASAGSEPVDAIVVDMHAEATSEKVALGHYLSGRVTAVWGTHTHIPTADETTLQQSTAYLTDVGMTALKDTVIGANKEMIIQQFLTQQHSSQMHDTDEHGPAVANAMLLECERGGVIKQWKRLHLETEV